MKFFEICAEVLVPKFTRAEVRLPVFEGIKNGDSDADDLNFTLTLILL